MVSFARPIRPAGAQALWFKNSDTSRADGLADVVLGGDVHFVLLSDIIGEVR